jgi:ABC-2 type transport system ATP-binding protein
MEEAQNLCTDIALIDNGVIIARGNPEEMINENETANLEQLFLKLTGKKLRD